MTTPLGLLPAAVSSVLLAVSLPDAARVTVVASVWFGAGLPLLIATLDRCSPWGPGSLASASRQRTKVCDTGVVSWETVREVR